LSPNLWTLLRSQSLFRKRHLSSRQFYVSAKTSLSGLNLSPENLLL
jgi:hypothetical protein